MKSLTKCPKRGGGAKDRRPPTLYAYVCVKLETLFCLFPTGQQAKGAEAVKTQVFMYNIIWHNMEKWPLKFVYYRIKFFQEDTKGSRNTYRVSEKNFL